MIDFITLRERVNRLANALLGLGLRRGDRVMDLQSNAHTYIETDLACARAGLVRVPVNVRLTVQDWAYIAENCAARALVYGRAFAGAAEELVQRAPGIDTLVSVDGTGPGKAYESLLQAGSPAPPGQRLQPTDLVSINYSSGTTGRPKGCMRTLRNRLASLQDMLVDLFQGGLQEDDIWLHAGPITHASGLFVLPHLAVGACQVVLNKFDPDRTLDLLRGHRVTGTVLVPTMIEQVLTQDVRRVDLSSLKRLVYAGAPMAVDRIRVANEVLRGTLVQFYGLVEAIPPLTVLSQADHASGRQHPDRLGSAGRACLGAELDLVDREGHPVPDDEPGELRVLGDHVMAGYWGMEDATGRVLRDGWLHTGDLARRDALGYVTILERLDDMIITGGFNVYPREIEDLIAQDEAVGAVAVIGLPDSTWGQAVTAVVVPRPGASLDVQRLDALCRARLASFKKPKRFELVDALPLTSAGKVNRKRLRAVLTGPSKDAG